MSKRRLLEATIAGFVYACLYFSGAGFWALIVIPYGLWEYWCGSKMAVKIFTGDKNE